MTALDVAMMKRREMLRNKRNEERNYRVKLFHAWTKQGLHNKIEKFQRKIPDNKILELRVMNYIPSTTWDYETKSYIAILCYDPQ